MRNRASNRHESSSHIVREEEVLALGAVDRGQMELAVVQEELVGLLAVEQAHVYLTRRLPGMLGAARAAVQKVSATTSRFASRRQLVQCRG